MRILVSLAVAEIFHQARGRVADVQRHRIVSSVLDIGNDSIVSGVDRIRFRGRSKVDHALREREFTFGQADEVERVFRVQRDAQRARIRKADVFGSESNEAPDDVERILTGLEHACEPVQGRVHIRVAQRLMQRRNDVVMLLAGLVVQKSLLRSLLDGCFRDGFSGRRPLDSQLENIQRGSRVAIRE